jgi:rRNA processing protein Gar1
MVPWKVIGYVDEIFGAIDESDQKLRRRRVEMVSTLKTCD